MKKSFLILLSVLLAFSLTGPVLGAQFEIDPYESFGDMAITWYQGYTPVIQNNILVLHLPLRAEGCVGDITVSLALEDPHVLLLAAEPKPVTVSPKDGLYPVRLTQPLVKNRRNGDYPMRITVTGRDSAGKEISETLPYILRIRDGRSTHEILEPLFSNLTANLTVGQEGTLELTVTNPTTTLSATDCRITVKDPQGDLQMAGTDRVTLSEILPGKSIRVSIPITVRGNASVALHDLEITFRCKVQDRETQWSRTFPVPITQEIRLEQGGVQMPSTFPGELTTMTLPLMNLGKSSLQNVLVKLEINSVLDPQSVLVGTLSPGETTQAKLTFTPKQHSVGIHSGTVTITCEDAYGNPFTQVVDVTLTVEEPIPEADIQKQEEKEGPNTWVILLSVLNVALVISLILLGTILTGKIHKLEEERL